MNAVNTQKQPVAGVYLSGEFCTQFGDEPDYTCVSLNGSSDFESNDVNSNSSWVDDNLTSLAIQMIPSNPVAAMQNAAAAFYDIGHAGKTRMEFSFLETKHPEGYYPDNDTGSKEVLRLGDAWIVLRDGLTGLDEAQSLDDVIFLRSKSIHAGCGGWFTIPGDDGSNYQAVDALTSCSQVEMLPNNTLTWVKQATPKATVTSPTSTTTPTISITNTAVGPVSYRLLIRNSAGELINPDEEPITIPAGESRDIAISELMSNFAPGNYTYQLMSTDNTDQPIEVTSGSFTIQAEQTDAVRTAAPDTGLAASASALPLVAALGLLAGGLSLRKRFNI